MLNALTTKSRWVCAGAAATIGLGSPALAIDDFHRERGRTMAAMAETYLIATQDPRTGGWSVPADEKSPAFPAITGLVVHGMLLRPGAEPTERPIARGLEYVLSFVKKDGGIYDAILPSYNTSICLSALSRARTPQASAAIGPAQEFLKRLQWSETAPPDTDPTSGIGEATTDGKTPEAPSKVWREHPFYGGMGYGRHGRPDLSNLQFMLQALHDSGLPEDDAAYQRALVYLARVQMLEKTPDGRTVNDMPYAKGSKQGGFIYATSLNRDRVGSGQTMVDEKEGFIEETLDDGTVASRLRCYGSMTYAGFKSMIYAGLTRDDPRVQAALGWIARNYTLAENPGVGLDGVYYYYLTFARAMNAFGEETITPINSGGEAERPRDWANDLVSRLETLQNADGSFQILDERWMENNPVLITAYCLIALREAVEE